MSGESLPGPEVDSADYLYRCITTAAWWVVSEQRPSSAAFKQPDFSADVASLAGSPDYTLRRFPTGCGLVSFPYSLAKTIGFVARLEIDPNFPDNQAHANVYNFNNPAKRKTMALKLAQQCTVIVVPSFES